MCEDDVAARGRGANAMRTRYTSAAAGRDPFGVLRGSVLRFDRAFSPADEDAWEAHEEGRTVQSGLPGEVAGTHD